MQKVKDDKLGRERLQRIIEMCIAIEGHSVDPFTLDVNEIISVIREYFPHWEKTEDLNLDSEAIHHLASVIKLQSEWVKQRSTSLYTDPFLLEEKISRASKDEMVSTFLNAWHPVIELEQLSLHSLTEALRYWEQLIPISERWKESPVNEIKMGTTTREELIKQRVLSDRLFSVELENYWIELKQSVERKGKDGKIRYWDFIGAKTYEETVQRAFLTSFLITYGYATLEIHPLEEEIFIKPFKKPTVKIGTEQEISVPISVPYDDWQKWRRGELD